MSETPDPPKALAGEPTPAALRNRILAGLLYAAGRFVPVPLVDDLLRAQVTRWMVSLAVPPGLPKEASRPLWADDEGCLQGCLRWSYMLTIKLLLFPIRKLLALLLSVRSVSRDLAQILLLGRVIDHARETGLLDPELPPTELKRRSAAIRKAFVTAMQGHDVRFFTTLLRTAIGPVRTVVRAAVRTLRSLRRTRAAAPTVGEGEKPVIDASVSRIQRAMEQSEIQEFLREFDRRVLAALSSLEQAPPPTPSSPPAPA